MDYPRWEHGYRKHGYWINEQTAVAGAGIAPPPHIGFRGSSFKLYSWWLYGSDGNTASLIGGEAETLKAAKRSAVKAYESQNTKS